MKKRNRLRIIPFALFQSMLMTLVGCVCGILYSFGGLIIDMLVSLDMLSPESMSTPGLSTGTLLAFGALLGMPLLFAVAGFVAGLAEAILFNFFVKLSGGINLDFIITSEDAIK